MRGLEEERNSTYIGMYMGRQMREGRESIRGQTDMRGLEEGIHGQTDMSFYFIST